MELLVVSCLIFVFIGIFAGYAGLVLKIGRETALRNELVSIRMAVEYFKIVNGRYPFDLRELVNKKLTKKENNLIITRNRFIESFRLDAEGYLIDPFMNRYDYNAQDNRVHSNTQGFLLW
jgi:hypothetical protein